MEEEAKRQFTDFLLNIHKKSLSLSLLMRMMKLYSQVRRGILYYHPSFHCFFYEFESHYFLMNFRGEFFEQRLYDILLQEAIVIPLVNDSAEVKDLYVQAREFCFNHMISYVDDTSHSFYQSQREYQFQEIEEDHSLLQAYQDGRQDGGEIGYVLAVKEFYDYIESFLVSIHQLPELYERFISQMSYIDYNANFEEIIYNERDLSVMYKYFEPYLITNEYGEEIIREESPQLVKKTKEIYDQLIQIRARKNAS